MIKVDYFQESEVADALLKYAVIVSQYRGEWIFVRHEERSTWEVPGGRREPDEPISLTAKRELIEETGAKVFEIEPICVYSVTLDAEKSYGLLCYAEIIEFGNPLNMEICEIKASEALPKELTYPLIQPELFKRVNAYLETHPIRYNRIELVEPLSAQVDSRTHELLSVIAAWHNSTPILWRPEYQPTDKDIQETINRLYETPHEDLFLMIASHGQQPIGFIWAYRQVEKPSRCMILSLYVEPKYRQCGISTALKVALEDWCRKADIQVIETTVHYTNHNMIKLNQKMGYEVGMVNMRKVLE